MITGVIGKKIDQTQRFLEDGSRIPVTVLSVNALPVVEVKTKNKHGYFAIQVGLDSKKRPTKAELGHAKRANLQKAPQYLKEIRLDKKIADLTEDQLPKVGDAIAIADVLKSGDIVHVTGISKGKGFAGVVKRHNFKGGPRTHGQSDRERAPGSIGQTTTPGRVYKGKRMAGHMGVVQKTVQNLKVIEVTENEILIKGLVPGPKNNIVVITKVGEDKKFVGLLKKEVQKDIEEIKVEEPKAEETAEAEKAQEPEVEQEVVSAGDTNESKVATAEGSSEPKEEENART